MAALLSLFALLVLCATQTEGAAPPPKNTSKGDGKGFIGKVLGGLDGLNARSSKNRSSKSKGNGSISSANLLAVGKLRENLLNFYCPTHQTNFPCTVRRGSIPATPSYLRPAAVHSPTGVGRQAAALWLLSMCTYSTCCPGSCCRFSLQNHEFTKKLKAAADANIKKAVLAERQATLAAMGPEERKRKMGESKHAFQDMYAAYCKRGAGAEISGYNVEVCTDPTMKQLYASKLPKLFGA
jgi:hypothetical protein